MVLIWQPNNHTNIITMLKYGFDKFTLNQKEVKSTYNHYVRNACWLKKMQISLFHLCFSVINRCLFQTMREEENHSSLLFICLKDCQSQESLLLINTVSWTTLGCSVNYRGWNSERNIYVKPSFKIPWEINNKYKKSWIFALCIICHFVLYVHLFCIGICTLADDTFLHAVYCQDSISPSRTHIANIQILDMFLTQSYHILATSNENKQYMVPLWECSI